MGAEGSGLAESVCRMVLNDDAHTPHGTHTHTFPFPTDCPTPPPSFRL